MAFTSGTATDYKDLLDKLRAYLVAQGWTVNRWTYDPSLTVVSELAVVGPGSPGGQPVNVSIRTTFDTGSNSYAWRVVGHQTYDDAAAFGFQPTNSPIHYFLLWPNAIDYRFYVNDRRFIVVAKIGVVYISMYAGFFLPFCLPTEYPYPFYIGATSAYLNVYTINNSGYRSMCDPGDGAASYLRRDGMTWAAFENHDFSSNDVDAPRSGYQIVWPYRGSGRYDTDLNYNDAHWGFIDRQRPSLSGKLPMYQAMLIDASDSFLAGMLDGVFVTSGFNRVPEQVLTHGGKNYRLFVNMQRTRPKDFFAVEEA